MSDVLKGNFEPKKKVSTSKGDASDLEEEFERRAMKRLGGSIAFVSKKKVKWNLDDN